MDRAIRLILHLSSFLPVGPLAQLVEQLTLNQRVRSSSLRRPTKSFEHLRGLCAKNQLFYKLHCACFGPANIFSH
jgi:hypothetical protein